MSFVKTEFFLKLFAVLFFLLSIYYLGNIRAGKADKPVTKVILKNEVVLFPDFYNTSSVIVNGFSSLENWGIWSIGDSSSIQLDFITEGNVDINICFHPFIEGSFDNSLLIFGGNEYFMESMEKCPVLKNCKVPLMIEFQNLQPTTPKSIGMNNDERQIALGLTQIKISKTKYEMSNIKCSI